MPPTRNPKPRHAPKTTRQDTQHRPHPSRGGARGYDLAVRQAALAIRDNGAEDDAVIDDLRQQNLHPSKSTTSRWARRQATEGHIMPFEMNGNRDATVLKGHQLMMLSLFRLSYPKATAAEANAFLFTSTAPGEQPRFYSDSQITEAENNLGLSRKKASTTAYQASLPINLARRWSFWNAPYPFGIAGTSRSTIIDFDEAAIFIESTNRGYGKCFLSTRAREEGPYNHSQKYTITGAIRGGVQGGCWVDVALRTGTSVVDTHDFIQNIIQQIGQGGVNAAGINNTHTFICDNLTAHHNPLIHLLINNNQHRLVFRAPYYPVDGPIEYFFNTIQQQLTLELYRVRTPQQLRQAIIDICQRTSGRFDNYFAHCGYAP